MSEIFEGSGLCVIYFIKERSEDLLKDESNLFIPRQGKSGNKKGAAQCETHIKKSKIMHRCKRLSIIAKKTIYICWLLPAGCFDIACNIFVYVCVCVRRYACV